MTKLVVKCKNCGFKFPSFTQMNEVAFKTAVLTNSAEECPGCSETLAYSKRDYFFENHSTQFYPTKKRDI
jgi:C4-type Zn-finger protein